MAKAKSTAPKIPLKGSNPAPAPQAPAPAPVSQSADGILNSLLPSGGKPPSHPAPPAASGGPPVPAQEPPYVPEDEDDGATIELPDDLFQDPLDQGVMSDDKPEGFEPNPPVSPEAREAQEKDRIAESLRMDALRATKANLANPAANVASKPLAPARPPAEVRKMLAEAQRVQPSKWRSRISVGMAYQYNGELHKAPEFIDRNWAAYDGGPALNIPGAGIVRRGQWVVVQNVLNEDDSIAHSEIKVYDDEVFRSLFIPDEG